MRWEITNNSPRVGDVRFKTKFAFLPTQVLSKLTNTDHMIWLELYIEEQEYKRHRTDDHQWHECWETVAKTIHI